LYTLPVEKSFYWRIIPDLVAVNVLTNVTPSDVDWDVYLEAIKKSVSTLRGVLVYSESAGLSAGQRARANEAYKNASVNSRTAIMSGSRLVRGVVTAMSWTLADNIKAFSTTDFDGAVNYLGFDAEEQLRTRVVLKQLARTANVQIEAFADESGQFRKKYL
jgi:hypothetical protein